MHRRMGHRWLPPRHYRLAGLRARRRHHRRLRPRLRRARLLHRMLLNMFRRSLQRPHGGMMRPRRHLFQHRMRRRLMI
jgi:hypothetical protein